MDIYEIPDFAGYYADKEGNIYTTLAQGCRNRYDLSKRIAPKKLNYRFTKHGYARVYMRRESTNLREDAYVHRIIAELFIENPLRKNVVNHKNCIRSDNSVNNLEWVTTEENLTHAMNFGSLGRDSQSGRFIKK